MDVAEYEPEIGQLCFGQPTQRLAVSGIARAAVEKMRDVWTSKMPDGTPSPFDNTGTRFDGSRVKVYAYSWGEEDQPFNIAWRDVRISWYKYAGRGMSCNRDMTLAECREMVADFRRDVLSEAVRRAL